MTSLISSPQRLGALLAEARKASASTQAEIAERADLRQATVSKVENGDQGVRLETVLSLLEANEFELVVRKKSILLGS
ncbi:helix-turn-helix domain-containing protein [Celeribacter halophilus]|uniref:helix-turn-helix domain-containing protein n=1 Tax=Celeribacter halophilus TaxID=576117 RepID=UPI0026E2789E|nr:helix-turn-helix domain-containing protein [Celeribacter halophilus]MDO6722431.1 helix-turn-helix domain-containing protein [Celeribacter halophilus]